jgi:hypothetical protein
VKQGNIPCWSLHRSRVHIFRMRVDLYLIKLPNTSEHSSSCCDALLYCSTCLAEIGCSTTSSVTTCEMQVEEEIVVSLIRRTRLHEINQNGPALAHGARSRE